MRDPALRLYHAPDDVPSRYAQWFELVACDRPPADPGFYLWHRPTGLTLHRGRDARGIGPDTSMLQRRAVRGSALARAVAARDAPTMLDLMAGLGRDGLACAQLGCKVTLVEVVPAIWAMLDDFVTRHGMPVDVVLGDAWTQMDDAPSPDVVYLDPMFDARPKRALPGKELQYLRELAGVDTRDTAAWVARARGLATDRVVLKRRVRDPVVLKPDWQIVASRVRYDVYRPAGWIP